MHKMTTVEKTKQLIKSMQAQGDSEEQIALIIGIDVEEVYAFLKEMREETDISNMEEVARDMAARGKTEDEIAGILDIDVRLVRTFLEKREI